MLAQSHAKERDVLRISKQVCPQSLETPESMKLQKAEASLYLSPQIENKKEVQMLRQFRGGKQGSQEVLRKSFLG